MTKRLYIPRAWIWAAVKQATKKNLAKVIDDEKYFNFQPYVFSLEELPRLLYSVS